MAEDAVTTGLENQNRRRIKNFFFKPQYPVRFANAFIAGGLVLMTGCVALIHQRLGAIDSILNSAGAMGAGGHISVYDAFTDITTVALGGFGLFVVYACVLAIVFSHRVSGPMTALIAQIDELKKGNYDYRRELRKGDELGPIHEALADLAVSLKTRARRDQQD